MHVINPETNGLFTDVAAIGPRQALLQHKEPIVPPVFVLVHHDVMATRQQGDELRVMDICIGTFPFPSQPLFTLKPLHIIHQCCPPGQALHPPQTHMWRHFLPLCLLYCSPLHSQSDAEKCALSPLRHTAAQHMN